MSANAAEIKHVTSVNDIHLPASSGCEEHVMMFLRFVKIFTTAFVYTAHFYAFRKNPTDQKVLR